MPAEPVLHPRLRAFLDDLPPRPAPPPPEAGPEADRRYLATRRATALTAPADEAVGEMWDTVLPGGDVPVRLYRPAVASGSAAESSADGLAPGLLYFHGGGWVLGDIAMHDGLCRRLANLTGAIVANVGYRLAPEHPYPSPLDDCFDALCWLAGQAGELGVDPGRLAVAGSSSGATLAAGVALRSRDRGGPPVAGQLLVYPALDAGADRVSYRRYGEGYFLSAAEMAWYWRQYIPDPQRRLERYASPGRADDLDGVAPAVVVTAELDPLRDEGEAYVEALRAAGVPAVALRAVGMIHGFLRLVPDAELSKAVWPEIERLVREALTTPAAEFGAVWRTGPVPRLIDTRSLAR